MFIQHHKCKCMDLSQNFDWCKHRVRKVPNWNHSYSLHCALYSEFQNIQIGIGIYLKYLVHVLLVVMVYGVYRHWFDACYYVAEPIKQILIFTMPNYIGISTGDHDFSQNLASYVVKPKGRPKWSKFKTHRSVRIVVWGNLETISVATK